MGVTMSDLRRSVIDAALHKENEHGNAASFETNVTAKIPKLVANINPIQDLHGYSNPWPAGGGVNKWHLYANGYYSSSGSFVSSNPVGASDKIPVNVGDSITFGAVNRGTKTITLRGYFFDSNDELTGSLITGGNSTTVTVPSGASTVALWFTESDFSDTMTQERCDSLGIMMVVGNSLPASFSPYSNICPITGCTEANVWATGKNLVDTSDIADYSKWSSTVATEGNMRVNGTNPIYSFTPLRTGETYTITVGYSDTDFPTYLYFGYYIGNVATRLAYITTNTIGRHSYTFTSIEGATYCFRMGGSGTASSFNAQVSKITSVQIERGSVSTSYVPFIGATIPVSWQSTAGTVYGGYVDVVSGLLTIDYERVVITETLTGTTHYSRFVIGEYGHVVNGYGAGNALKLYVGTASQMTDNSFEILNSSGYNNSAIYMRFDYEGSTGADEKNYNNAKLAELSDAGTPLEVVYKIANPVTYQLTPTQVRALLGKNNVWADCGSVDVDYWKH